jgi:hypothetical protein
MMRLRHRGLRLAGRTASVAVAPMLGVDAPELIVSIEAGYAGSRAEV